MSRPTSSRMMPLSLRKARLAVSFFFLLNGMLLGNWITRIPAIQKRLGIDASELGTALLGSPTGSLAMMLLLAWLLHRVGSARLTRIAGLGYAAAVALPTLAPNLIALTAALTSMGLCSGVLNVTINAQAVAVERAYGRPIMISFHALFSVGGMIGSSCGGLLASWHVPPEIHLPAVGLFLGILSLVVGPWLVSDDAKHASSAPAEHGADLAPAPLLGPGVATILGLAVIAFCIMCSEQAAADWSALYLGSTGAGPGLAGAGYAVFALTMAAGRVTGDRLTLRFGPVGLVRGGTMLAAAGLCLALLWPEPAVVLVGFACLGAGLSCIMPIAFGAAARMQGYKHGAVLAAVTAGGYAGMLAGPPLIGSLADAFTLRVALGLLVVYSMIAATLARSVAPRPAPVAVVRHDSAA